MNPPPSQLPLTGTLTLQSFVELQQRWYAKADGSRLSDGTLFDDIEVSDGSGGHRDRIRGLGRISWERWTRLVEPGRAYFAIADELLHTLPWPKWPLLKTAETIRLGLRAGDLEIWRMHCDGASVRTIAARRQQSVGHIFNRLKHILSLTEVRSTSLTEVRSTSLAEETRTRRTRTRCAFLLRVPRTKELEYDTETEEVDPDHEEIRRMFDEFGTRHCR